MRQRERLYNTFKPLLQKPKKNETSFYAIIEGRQAGPIKEKELKKFISNGDITSDTLMWTYGLSEWQPANQLPIVYKYLLLASNKRTQISKGIISNSSLREDLLKAITTLGYCKNDYTTIVDKVIQDNPGLSMEKMLKIILAPKR
jgi:Holliday junction resolvasome RuvABC DNA-binding subunit